MNGNTLEFALQQASWEAVDEALRLGAEALPTVKKYSTDEAYKKRQIAIACAGVIKGESAAQILTAGLRDENVNVRLTAAKALKAKPNPAATEAVVERLENSPEEVLRELLALTAGSLPGKKTVEVLRKIAAADEGEVSVNAQMALAKLGDGEAKQAIINQLDDPLPRTRYNALERLIYINDPNLARYVPKLLRDKNPALKIGDIYSSEFRRVCDQAVDTLNFLLKLSVSFRTSPEIIYSDEEILQVESKTR